MLFTISNGIIILYFMIYCILIILPIRVTRKELLALWYIFIIALAVFSFFAEPSTSDDLHRHYRQIEEYRNGTRTLFSSPLYTFSFWCWLVSLFSRNGWLPFSAVLIWGSLIGKIIKHYIKNNSYNGKAILLYYLAVLGGCSVFYIISGVRNALTFAICFYAYYFYYKKNNIKWLVINLVACGLHVSALLAVFLLWIYERVIKEKNMLNYIKVLLGIGMLGAIYQTSLFDNFILKFPNAYIQLIGVKLIGYKTYTKEQNIENTIKLAVLLIYLLFFLYVRLKKKRVTSKLPLFFTLTSLATYPFLILFERLPYMLGIVSFSFFNEIVSMNKGLKKSAVTYILFAIFLFQLLFSFYQMVSHIEFNGTDLQPIMRKLFRLNYLGL